MRVPTIGVERHGNGPRHKPNQRASFSECAQYMFERKIITAMLLIPGHVETSKKNQDLFYDLSHLVSTNARSNSRRLILFQKKRTALKTVGAEKEQELL